MSRRAVTASLLVALLTLPPVVSAQQTRVYRVGVILFGGPHSSAVDGLRDGLREHGLDEGKQVVLDVRDARADLKAVAAAARNLEEQKADVIVAMTTGVTVAAKGATKSIPIVFYSGSDPVALGLVQSYRRPGGRLTGIHSQSATLAGKRLELLREMVPRLHRVVTFYRPDAPTAQPAVKIAREAARQLHLELVERPVASAEELRAGLRALRPGEAGAFLYVGGGMAGHVDVIIESARVKRLPTMFSDRVSVARGGLAAYGESYYTIGRLSARHVQRVLSGADPGDLPIEQVDKFHFVVNLKTARAVGLTLPPALLARVDEVIQ